MFFLIHSQVFLRVTLDCIFLIFNHWFLHGHKLTDRISFEGIEKMLKSIPKMLCILIYYLWHNLSLLFMFIMNRFADYFFCVRLLWYIFFKRYFFIVRCLIKYTWFLYGMWVLWIWKWAWRCWFFFPSLGKLIKIIEVCLIDEFSHVHLNLNNWIIW